MAAQQPSPPEEHDTDGQTAIDKTAVLDQEEQDNPDDILDQYEAPPEVPLSDAKHDQTIILLVVLVGLGMLVLMLYLNFFSVTGIFGSGCNSYLSNRIAQCYQSSYGDSLRYEYVPTSMRLNNLVIPTAASGTATPLPR